MMATQAKIAKNDENSHDGADDQKGKYVIYYLGYNCVDIKLF